MELPEDMRPGNVRDLRGANARPRPADHLAPGGKDREASPGATISFIGNASGPWAMVDAGTGTVLCTGFGLATYQAMLITAQLAQAALAQLLPERIRQICEESSAEVQRHLDAVGGGSN